MIAWTFKAMNELYNCSFFFLPKWNNFTALCRSLPEKLRYI